MTLKRVRPGLYATHDERHWIVRTTTWPGPCGGNHHRWEHATRDATGCLCIDGAVFCTTLRDAKREVLALISQEPSP